MKRVLGVSGRLLSLPVTEIALSNNCGSPKLTGLNIASEKLAMPVRIRYCFDYSTCAHKRSWHIARDLPNRKFYWIPDNGLPVSTTFKMSSSSFKEYCNENTDNCQCLQTLYI